MPADPDSDFRTNQKISDAITQHALPDNFFEIVEHYYHPLSTSISQRFSSAHSKRKTRFIGIQGSQGSGKSTCASFLKILLEEENSDLNVVVASIDDFYLTKSEREDLARDRHPLFLTRGVPGTHDIELINSVFDNAEDGQALEIPVFDKAKDDRAHKTEWQYITKPVDILILEGWCVGITPQDKAQLEENRNSLEEREDHDKSWRTEVNRALEDEYKNLFKRLDVLVSLQAPSFDCVLGWRQLQEQKLITKLQSQGKSTSLTQTPIQIERFISFFQRLTEHALATMPEKADYLLSLNKHHQFTKLKVKP